MAEVLATGGLRVKKGAVIGRSALHSTHRLAHQRGVFFCIKCGAYATVRPKGLKKDCKLKAKGTRRSNLKRLVSGLRPHSLAAWPRTFVPPSADWDLVPPEEWPQVLSDSEEEAL